MPPPPGWTQQVQQTGSGDSAVVQKVTWTGGKTPTGEDSLFQFLAQPASAKTYTFQVQQTYSDGSIVNWAGPESSAAPAPTIEAKASLGGGGVSVLTIIALIVGVLGLARGRVRARQRAAVAVSGRWHELRGGGSSWRSLRSPVGLRACRASPRRTPTWSGRSRRPAASSTLRPRTCS